MKKAKLDLKRDFYYLKILSGLGILMLLLFLGIVLNGDKFAYEYEGPKPTWLVVGLFFAATMVSLLAVWVALKVQKTIKTMIARVMGSDSFRAALPPRRSR